MEILLVVEDDIHQAELYRQELGEDGYEVILAHNGHDALKKIRQHDIEIVILDIRMPEMDGIELLGKILSHDSKMPVIIHTAYSHYKNDFMTWAAEHYVVKSSDLGELKAKIRESLELRRNTTPQKG